MRYVLALALLLLPSLAVPASAQQPMEGDKNWTELEKTLWDADQQWLCAGPYEKPYKDCVEFRSKYWDDQFFEVYPSGVVTTKLEMVASQSAGSGAPGTGPFPGNFKLRAVYGNFAVATDRTAFKAVDAGGPPYFIADSRWLRLFVLVNGKWRPAAGAGVPTVAPKQYLMNMGQQSTSGKRRSPDEKLEKELAAIDTKWLDSAMHGRMDYLNQLFVDQWFEILGWVPTADVTKATAMAGIPKLNPKPGEGVFPDQFKLWAVYGDIALATDRRTRKWTDYGHFATTPHRSLLVFVKQNGQWRSAATALVPIAAPQ
jgi:hypothetical protein